MQVPHECERDLGGIQLATARLHNLHKVHKFRSILRSFGPNALTVWVRVEELPSSLVFDESDAEEEASYPRIIGETGQV